MKVQRLTRALEVRRPREEVFAFFADPFTLELVSPPWLGLHIEEPPTGPPGEGTIFVFSLRLHGIPFRWQSRITEWNPPHRFVHEQVEGPYLHWTHQHRFDDAEGGTLVRDHVEYALPEGLLVERLIRRHDIDRVFDYRRDRSRELLAE